MGFGYEASTPVIMIHHALRDRFGIYKEPGLCRRIKPGGRRKSTVAARAAAGLMTKEADWEAAENKIDRIATQANRAILILKIQLNASRQIFAAAIPFYRVTAASESAIGSGQHTRIAPTMLYPINMLLSIHGIRPP